MQNRNLINAFITVLQTSISLCLFVYLSVCLSVSCSLSVCMSVLHCLSLSHYPTLSVSLSLSLSLSLSQCQVVGIHWFIQIYSAVVGMLCQNYT